MVKATNLSIQMLLTGVQAQPTELKERNSMDKQDHRESSMHAVRTITTIEEEIHSCKKEIHFGATGHLDMSIQKHGVSQVLRRDGQCVEETTAQDDICEEETIAQVDI